MTLLAFEATQQLESRLSQVYENLYNKESKIAKVLSNYSRKEIINTEISALLSNLALNGLLITGLYHYLC